jgi:phosphoribosylaminoimidazolecarboxamide formyltransferase / IMP cyclohydrolase
LREFDEPAASAVKHVNPCGVGVGKEISEAFGRAREADPVSIFGGIVALNRPVDVATAEQLREIFLEIVLAPAFSPKALEILKTRKNLRLLVVPEGLPPTGLQVQSVPGGLLAQQWDRGVVSSDDWEVATNRAPKKAEIDALRLAWRVVKHVKSNAIVVSSDEMTLGIGAGQMNRVGAAKIALDQAGDRAQGAAMASDAFFPMRDTVDTAAAAGISAIIQPGGSIRDAESIEAADEAGIAMVFTGMRHFRH